MLPKSVKRSLPYIQVLIKSRSNVNKKEVLCKFPQFVIDDIVEILYNILTGKLKIESKALTRLMPYKKPIVKLVNTPSKNRKPFVYKQTGGFIGAVLPVIASLIGGLVSNVV